MSDMIITMFPRETLTSVFKHVTKEHDAHVGYSDHLLLICNADYHGYSPDTSIDLLSLEMNYFQLDDNPYDLNEMRNLQFLDIVT